MTTDAARFEVAVIFATHVDVVPEGYMTSIMDDPPVGALLPIACANCGQLQLVWGDVEAVEASERSMGPEVIHSSHHLAECTKCKAEVNVSVDYQEYPVGTLQPVESDQNLGKVVHLANLKELVHWTRRATKDAIEMQNQPDEWEWLEKQLAPGQPEIHRFIGDHRRLLEFRRKLVIVLGNYHTSGHRLEEIMQEIKRLGLEPALVKEFADFEEKATPEKAGHVMDLARFCIMLDDQPGGQQPEYRIAQERDVTLVHLVDQEPGTTYMHGTRHLTNQNIKRIVTTQGLPAAVREGVEWGNRRFEERKRLVTGAEPWRGS